jgi:hypothetical protein
MKVWPIDPLVPRNLRLEVPEKLPQGLLTLKSQSLGPEETSLTSAMNRAGRGMGNTPGCGELSSGLWYQTLEGNTSSLNLLWGQVGNNPKNRDNPQPTWLPDS